MPQDIEVVEQLIIDALKNDAAVNAVVKTFDRYDGQFGIDDLKDIKGLPPACFVTYVRDGLDASTRGRTYIQKNQYNVVVFAKDLRGKFDAKQQALSVTKLVHNALHNNELGLENVYPGLERFDRIPLLVTPEIAVFEMSFRINWVA